MKRLSVILLVVKTVIIALSLLFTSCDEEMSSRVIVQNKSFTVTPDSVVQDTMCAYAVNDFHIISNYDYTMRGDSVPSEAVVRLRFGGFDNELAAGKGHYCVLGDTVNDISAGTVVTSVGRDTKVALPSKLRLRVHLGAMHDSLASRGYWETPVGDTVYASDMKGVWASVNIGNEYAELMFQLTDTGKGRYELDCDIQPQEKILTPHEWQIAVPEASMLQYVSDQHLFNACYNMSASALARLRTQAGYKSSGTTFVAQECYAIYLTLAYLDPEGSKKTLMSMTSDGRITVDELWGDTDHARFIWTAAAWEVYNATCDKQWLKTAFEITNASIDSIATIMTDEEVSLLCGPANVRAGYASQYYPTWMNSAHMVSSKSLNTNIIMEHTQRLLGAMAEELELDADDYNRKADRLKDAINHHLWNEDYNYYSQLLSGSVYSSMQPYLDNMGQALAILWGVADDNRAEDVVGESAFTHYGIQQIYPSNARWSLLNNRSSLWLQSLWNLSAARVNNHNVLRRGLGAMLRSQALMASCAYDWNSDDGTPIAQGADELCNACAMPAMAFRVIAGMNFLPEGIEFNPVVPVCFTGDKKITNFRYRKAVLNITIKGVGDEVESLVLDNNKIEGNYIDGGLEGMHEVVITMRSTGGSGKANVVARSQTLPLSPHITWLADTLIIDNYDAQKGYSLIANGRRTFTLSDTVSRIPAANDFAEYSVVSVTRNGLGVPSEPHYVMPRARTVGLVNFAPPPAVVTTLNDRNATRVVKLPDDEHVLNVRVYASVAGSHYLQLAFYNSESLSLCEVLANGHHQAVLPLAPSGQLSKQMHSGVVKVKLLKGLNTLSLRMLTAHQSALLHSLIICEADDS